MFYFHSVLLLNAEVVPELIRSSDPRVRESIPLSKENTSFNQGFY